MFIKRIIALPGIFWQEGTVLLNGDPDRSLYKRCENFGPLFIEEGLLAMGDNREPWGSWDSRNLAPSLETILGRAEFIISPSGKIK